MGRGGAKIRLNRTPKTMRTSRFASIRVFLEMIKVSHSIFALPFALAAAVLAADGLPEWVLVIKIIVACVFARTAAMAFNRWADRLVDARNPRTATRAIPAGELTAAGVLVAAILSAAFFVLCAYTINPLAFALSPVALVILFGYSFTKRFTQFSHLVLGLALGLSPIGAWIAVRGELAVLPVLLGLAVLFWTAGFDVIYSCQDVEFDRRHDLHSLPSRWGNRRALWISRGFHAVTLALLLAVGIIGSLGLAYGVGVALVAAILIYEQSLVRPDDLSKVNLAFFTLNGCVSLVFMLTTVVDVVV